MSGVFGIVNLDKNLDKVMNTMGQVMHHRPWYTVECYTDLENHSSIGRIGIGIFNTNPQPVWNSKKNITLTMAGEFYDAPDLDRRNISDEQYALKLYEMYGDSFAQKLNGAFIIAIWDKTLKKLTIVNDRFALYRLFYSYTKNQLIFSPEIKGILSTQLVTRKLDLVALAQYMRFQHLLGTRTFFENIELLPGASILSFDAQTSSLKIDTYWNYDNISYRPEVKFEEAVEETRRLLRAAVTRLSSDDYRPGVFLSGGLDGRTIAGLIERRPFSTLSFGSKDCRDVVYAQKIAKAVRSDHHWVDFPNGDWVLDNIDFHMDLTEGLHSWIHMHGISALPLAREIMDVNLSGWDGGTIMGHQDNIEPLQCDPFDDAAFLSHQFYLYNQKFTWPGLTEAEERLLYQDNFANNIIGLAFDSFKEAIHPYLGFRRDVRGEYFFLSQHCRYLTQNMVVFGRSHIEQRFPYFDYALFEFIYSLPATLRADRFLHRSVIQLETPKLSYIPYDHDNLPPTTHQLIRGSIQWKNRLQNAFNHHALPIFPEHPTLYADYENYLRHELRTWAENILYDRRTIERGFFKQSFLNTLIGRHISNREPNIIGKIAPIISYELMLRQLYD